MTYNIDKLRPLVNESVKCAKEAKNHEERVACRAVALHKLRQAFTPPNMKQSKK